MNKFLKPLALLGLLITVLPAILFLTGGISLDLGKSLMTAGMVLWYVAAIPWLGTERN